MLVGLRHSTPRAKVHTTALLGYQGGLLEASATPNNAGRCERLQLELCWEAIAKGADQPLTGLARVTMSMEDRADCVRIDEVKIKLPESGPAPEAHVLADVEYAVQSLDSAIMDRLNVFLWDVESHNRAAITGSSMD